jgi:hypothetical protein
VILAAADLAGAAAVVGAAAFGFAGAVKYWAVIPARCLFAVCLRGGRALTAQDPPDGTGGHEEMVTVMRGKAARQKVSRDQLPAADQRGNFALDGN